MAGGRINDILRCVEYDSAAAKIAQYLGHCRSTCPRRLLWIALLTQHDVVPGGRYLEQATSDGTGQHLKRFDGSQVAS